VLLVLDLPFSYKFQCGGMKEDKVGIRRMGETKVKVRDKQKQNTTNK